jgi:hypothetical protein
MEKAAGIRARRDVSDATVIKKFGDLPDDFSALRRSMWG